jgi:hypothetical protein
MPIDSGRTYVLLTMRLLCPNVHRPEAGAGFLRHTREYAWWH